MRIILFFLQSQWKKIRKPKNKNKKSLQVANVLEEIEVLARNSEKAVLNAISAGAVNLFNPSTHTLLRIRPVRA